jgi:hypothetical protein
MKNKTNRLLAALAILFAMVGGTLATSNAANAAGEGGVIIVWR